VTHVNTVSSGKSFPQRCVRTPRYALQFHAWSDGTTRFKVEAMSGLSYNALAEAARTDAKIKSRVDQYIIGTPLAFYDLQADANERVNRIDEATFRPEFDRLAGLLIAHMERTEDPQLGAFRAALQKRQR
jgi:N-sulfoglucosamine sulfohydrolase